jgi:hypothetical protein
MFELLKNQVIALEVVFRPTDSIRYEQDIVIVCDNCTVMEYKLSGEAELAQIEVATNENDLDLYSLNSLQSPDDQLRADEFKDISSDKILKFPLVNPKVFSRRMLTIINKSYALGLIICIIIIINIHQYTTCLLSSSMIDYSWLIYKPVFEDNLLMEPNQKENEHVLDKDSSFKIAPKQGTLDKNEAKNFEIIFSPNKVSKNY